MKRLFIAMTLVGCGGSHPTPATHAHHPDRQAQEAADLPASQPHAKHHQKGHHHSFDDPEKWSAKWDTAERDAWQKPDAVVAALKLAPDARIADIGAGTGYFALRFAKAVPQGVVYAVDLEPKMVAFMAARAATAGLANVKPVAGQPANPNVPEAVDLVFLSNTYHHIDDRSAYFGRLKAQLRPGGRLAIVDFKVEDTGEGPPKHMRIGPEQLAAELAPAGYREVVRDTELLPRQYLSVFEVAPAE